MESVLDSCDIGVKLREECHKLCYVQKAGLLDTQTNLTAYEKELLSRRVHFKPKTICLHHRSSYIHKFEHLHGRACSDPLHTHDRPMKIGLKVITLSRALQSETSNGPVLIPGKKLCVTCMKNLNPPEIIHAKEQMDSQGSVESASQSSASEYIPSPEVKNVASNAMDDICKLCGVDTVGSCWKKMNSDIRSKFANQVSGEIGNAFHRISCCAFGISPELPPISLKRDSFISELILNDSYLQLINEIRTKLQGIRSKRKIIKILTLAPSEWSAEKIADEFKVSRYLAKRSKEIRSKYGILPKSKNVGNRKLAQSTVNLVLSHYNEDDISRPYPGVRDYVTVKTETGNEKHQKRLMLCNLDEAYKEFKLRNPGIKVGFSTFASLRPPYCVLPGPNETLFTCVCLIHQNVKLILDSLGIMETVDDMIELLVCNSNSEECMLGKCTNCPGNKDLSDFVKEAMNNTEGDTIKFKQWINNNKFELKDQELSKGEMLKFFLVKFEKVQTHHFIAKKQAEYYRESKKNIEDHEAVIVIDFSQNYEFFIQDAVAGWHWNKEQCTICPVVSYMKDKNPLSTCFISDSLEHGASTVNWIVREQIKQLRKIDPFLQKIKLFSDGAVTQFKNKNNFINLTHIKDDLELEHLEWNFYASYHGKGVSDGVGGTIKRLTRRASIQRPINDQIRNAKELFQFTSKNIHNVISIFMPKEDLATLNKSLQRRYNSAKTLQGTQSHHFFCVHTDNSIAMKKISLSTETTIVYIT